MPRTNVHIHVFTADHTPEIQFFYMLWNVFESMLVRDGIRLHRCFPPLRFELEDLARYRRHVELAFRVAHLVKRGRDLDDPVRGLARTVRTMTHADWPDIYARLGIRYPEGGQGMEVGQDALAELIRRLGAAQRRGEPCPFDAVLAEIARDLYELHDEKRDSRSRVDQRSLLETFFQRGPEDGKASYQRVIILTVNFDCAFQGLHKYGLSVNPGEGFEFVEQIKKIRELVLEPPPLGDNGSSQVEIWPFLCVDPRWQPPDGQALTAWVEEQMADQVFKGLKIYPPMGFVPADPRLSDVFAWCKTKSIPVTSHCSMGGGGLRGLEARGLYAHPYEWKPVLDRLEHHPGPGVFRLNLAHFSDLSRSLDREAKRTWSDEIMKMMLRYNRSGKVEIYSDISYAWVQDSERPTFEANVKKLSHLNPRVDLAPWDDDIDLGPWDDDIDLTPWILFGSDWWNYLPDCQNEEEYVENIQLARLFDARQLDDNADWFLGVNGPGPRPN